MLWRGQELTEDSLVWRSALLHGRVVRAGDNNTTVRTHLDYIERYPHTVNYRWPTLFELMEYKNESNLA